MFACYAGIGVGHDAMHLERHAYGLVANMPGDDEEDIDEMEEVGLGGALQNTNNKDVDKDKEDEEDEDEDSEDRGSDSSDDTNFDTCF